MTSDSAASHSSVIRTVLFLVLRAEVRLEIHRKDRAVIAQFRRLHGIFLEVAKLLILASETSALFGDGIQKLNKEVGQKLEDCFRDFCRAKDLGEAAVCCRRSRDIHFYVGALAVLGCLSSSRSVFMACCNALEDAIGTLKSDKGDVDHGVYLSNMKYRLGSIKALEVLDKGLEPSNVMDFATLNISGLTNYLLAPAR